MVWGEGNFEYSEGKLIPKEVYLFGLEHGDQENLTRLIELVTNQERKSGLQVRLVAVGGTVDQKRANQPHKDIDICCYCPQLAITNGPEGCQNFDSFTEFFLSALRETGWESNIRWPFFDSWEHAGDGSITFIPKTGKPIEILPLRRDSEKVVSFDKFLASAAERGAVLVK